MDDQGEFAPGATGYIFVQRADGPPLRVKALIFGAWAADHAVSWDGVILDDCFSVTFRANGVKIPGRFGRQNDAIATARALDALLGPAVDVPALMARKTEILAICLANNLQSYHLDEPDNVAPPEVLARVDLGAKTLRSVE